MNFADVRFWGILAASLLAILMIRLVVVKVMRPNLGHYDRAALAIMGLVLLGCVSLLSLGIFAAVSVTTYLGLHLILKTDSSQKRRAKWLWLLIPLQLSPLLFYKYGGFLENEILGLESHSFTNVLIPVGISFYTFQLISFAVDTLKRSQPLPSPLNTLNFAGFFPQIVAGPIERRDALLPQLENFRFRWDKKAIETGLTWIILGLFFKRCLADNLALTPLVHSGTNPFLVWLDTMMFGFRIYFDFCGYSLMALGVAQCLGIRLTLNFRSPYGSSNIADFWRRWHVTLSTWFRDYIYLPLGGSRTRFWTANILIVFAISGIWHGAGWNFLIWGGMHGFFLLVYRLPMKVNLPRAVGFLLTHFCVFLAWLCFYETDTQELFRKLGLLLNPASYDGLAVRSFIAACLSPKGLDVFAILGIVVCVISLEMWSLRKQGEPYRFLRTRGAAAILIFLTVILSPISNNDFIYFAF
jgi:D-alanyl-lipoteichoic acid acyltransferase DltB (MBOAT superfamily)